jgi:hypothetical protein
MGTARLVGCPACEDRLLTVVRWCESVADAFDFHALAVTARPADTCRLQRRSTRRRPPERRRRRRDSLNVCRTIYPTRYPTQRGKCRRATAHVVPPVDTCSLMPGPPATLQPGGAWRTSPPAVSGLPLLQTTVVIRAGDVGSGGSSCCRLSGWRQCCMKRRLAVRAGISGLATAPHVSARPVCILCEQ